MTQDYNISEIFAFLQRVKENNNRAWFAEHKGDYLSTHKDMIVFADAVLSGLQKHDHIETPTGKKSLYRIYRDVRFSKDKTPYNTHFSGGFTRATKQLRGGYYFHLKKGDSFVGGGFWGPNAQDIKHIRKQIASDPGALTSILNQKDFKSTFGAMLGDQLKTAPRGYDIDDPAIDLLRYKQFILSKSFTDKEVMSKDFHLKVVDTFCKMRPFLDYMSDILTTDLNGELLE